MYPLILAIVLMGAIPSRNLLLTSRSKNFRIIHATKSDPDGNPLTTDLFNQWFVVRAPRTGDQLQRLALEGTINPNRILRRVQLRWYCSHHVLSRCSYLVAGSR